MPTEPIECDVLVIGTGAAGSAAAITAKRQGLDVLMVEKEAVFGGTTVFSGGWLWAPGNPLARAAGFEDSLDDVRTYVRLEAGNLYDEDRMEAFLENIPKMVDFFEQNTSVHFFVGLAIPDYHAGRPGSRDGGRSICAMPINGRELGPYLKRLKMPRRELLVLGLTIISGPDIKHFFRVGRSVRSTAYVLKRLALSLWDRAFYGRDLQLGNGAALAARMLKTIGENGIPILFSSPAKSLILEEGRVRGAVVERDGAPVEIRARRGVVIATGGFPGNFERRRELFPHKPSATQHYSLAPETNTGDGLALGESVGGRVAASLLSPAAWMPVSRVPYPDGTTGTFMHMFDRGKPGIIAVDSSGRRFVNESASYVDFVAGMIRSYKPGESAYGYLIGDHPSVRRYGLGFAKPAPMPIGGQIRSGYLIRADTIEELAARIGVDPTALKDTVARFNEHARRGEDPEFGKGSQPYNRYLGDPDHKPNPCIGPLETAPFYAVKILPGDIGTFAGLYADRFARVLGETGAPIEGLYAVGADNASVFGGAYPGGGSTLGPAVTFGYIAGMHLASVRDAGA
jgi:succinate dehydrogenase/fumarate reductase flavoprotein subunit